MRLLFSFFMLGAAASLPAWRMTQPAREASNSSVNRRGNGVAVNSRVGVGPGVTVAGTDVGGGVAVGKSEVAGVGDAGRQAVRRRKHPVRRIFFMALIKTQLPRALFQTISSNDPN